MKKYAPFYFALALLCCFTFRVQAQSPKLFKDIFPPGTTLEADIPYANDTLAKHRLDIYLPPAKQLSYPVIVWIHGGAWMSNDKHADMSYMVNTIRALLIKGYAIASVDYRWSTTAPFPAQIQDCNAALEYLYKNGAQYNIDNSRIALMGFSAGGHLATLLGLSNNDHVKEFYYDHRKTDFKIRAVFDFYGPADFFTLKGHDSPDPKNPINLLLGGTVAEKPKLARMASPVTYIDPNDPPFLIVQGAKDQSVNPSQATELSRLLTKAHVPNEVIMVPNAPHYGPMFDADYIRKAIFSYLDQYMQ